MAIIFQLRRDSSASWVSINPTLSLGEIGYDTTNKKIKIGDGTTNWNNLPYATVLDSDLNLKVTNNSASFIGTPTAPTASAGTNTGQIATTSFVTTALNNLVTAAPATLDTLNELAVALGNDPNFANATSSAIGQRLTIANASATYLGVSASSNFLPLTASNSFVSRISFNQQTASVYTLAFADINKMVEMNTNTTSSIVIPSSYSIDFPIGSQIDVLLTGTGSVTFNPSVSLSSSSITWTTLTNSFTSNTSINKVVYGNGVWIAIAGEGATDGQINTSTNGITWVSRTPPFSSSAVVDIDFGQNVFVACTASCVAVTTDGISWNAYSVGQIGSQTIRCVAYGNGVFTAGIVANTGNDLMATSTNGITWTTHAHTGFGGADVPGIRKIAYGNGYFVGHGDSDGSTPAFAWSTSGSVWFSYVPTLTQGPTSVNKIVYGGGMWVAAGNSGVIYSTFDPESYAWITRTSNVGGQTIMNGLAYGNGRWLASSINGNMSTSTNGMIWTTVTVTNQSASVNSIDFVSDQWILGSRSLGPVQMRGYAPVQLNSRNSSIRLTNIWSKVSLLKRRSNSWIMYGDLT